ncbi:transposase-like protein [Sulfitobacter undariae]|uniref:Transposase-like protein n=1 Tax=Sulfitobacter undariae TaxID=1563671 RepID=A0A7W6E778_9RHOB|nr:transposase-like protein [Sulfitobacter undariae]
MKQFGPLFAAEIRKKRVSQMRAYSNWQWHLDEVFVKINGETHYLWRAVDHEGEVLESFVTKSRDRETVLKFLRKTMKRHGRPHIFVTDRLRSYGAALKVIGSAEKQEMAAGSTIELRIHTSHFEGGNGPCFASDGCEPCRYSSPSTPRSITISIRNDISTADQTSS